MSVEGQIAASGAPLPLECAKRAAAPPDRWPYLATMLAGSCVAAGSSMVVPALAIAPKLSKYCSATCTQVRSTNVPSLTWTSLVHPSTQRGGRTTEFSLLCHDPIARGLSLANSIPCFTLLPQAAHLEGHRLAAALLPDRVRQQLDAPRRRLGACQDRRRLTCDPTAHK